MRYLLTHIRSVIESYQGAIPLAHFLKNDYRQFPKLGSRDRRMLSEMAYSWYRCAKGLDEAWSFEQKMKAALQLCKKENLLFLFADTDLPEYSFDPEKLFPASASFSEGISRSEWLHSMLMQPLLFIRIRKNKEKIIRILQEKNIVIDLCSDDCIGLPNNTKLESFFPADWYVVQDASSQQTGTCFQPKAHEHWWDCCAGAGGKSLLLKDQEASVKLTVSDQRKSILHNLSERFKLYGHEVQTIRVVDATNEQSLSKAFGNTQFDHIICDVPCTGSGTWARTPEQLYFFKEEQLKEYPERQKAIAQNVLSFLKPGGKLFYITCSVFKAENEEVVQQISANKMMVTDQKLINGLQQKADSLFITVLQKI